MGSSSFYKFIMVLTISIIETKTVKPPGKHIVYVINVEFNNWKITIEKRYNDFLELHRVMKLSRRFCNE